MRHTVVWLPEVERELVEIWLRAADRSAVARAADMIDRLLAHSPKFAGKAIDETLRVLVVSPLVVAFRCHDADMLVKVVFVGRAR